MQYVTSMGQHNQEESEGRQTEGGEREGRGRGGLHDHHLAQRSQQHQQDIRMEEADRSQRNLL